MHTAALPDVSQAPAGRIINIASTASLKGYAYVSAYCAAKHGVLGLTRRLALELAGTGARSMRSVPALPRPICLPPRSARFPRPTGMSAGRGAAQLAAVNPQGRLIEPDEVAQTAVWLCSELPQRDRPGISIPEVR